MSGPHQGRLAMADIAIHPDIASAMPRLEGQLWRDFVADVRQRGVTNPVHVGHLTDVPDLDGRWVLLEGHNRHRAAVEAGQTDLPVTFQPDQELLTAVNSAYREQALRRNLSAADLKARLMPRCVELERRGWSLRDIGDALGISHMSVKRYLQSHRHHSVTAVTGVTGGGSRVTAKPLTVGEILERVETVDPRDRAVQVRPDRLEDAVEETEAVLAYFRAVHDALLDRLDRRAGTEYPPSSTPSRRRLPPGSPAAEMVEYGLIDRAVGRSVADAPDELTSESRIGLPPEPTPIVADDNVTMAELRQLAKVNGVTVARTDTKESLAAKITAAGVSLPFRIRAHGGQ
jgi:ParB-like chromosome segregation protein Spo0J